jgi:hypothetical protein
MTGRRHASHRLLLLGLLVLKVHRRLLLEMWLLLRGFVSDEQ